MSPSVSILPLLAALVAAPAPDRTRDGRLLQAIEVDAAGTSGIIRTAPEFLGEAAGEFHFGAPHCPKTSLGPGTLDQLHQALRTRQLVTLRPTEATATAEHKCLGTVVFWAPEP